MPCGREHWGMHWRHQGCHGNPPPRGHRRIQEMQPFPGEEGVSDEHAVTSSLLSPGWVTHSWMPLLCCFLWDSCIACMVEDLKYRQGTCCLPELSNPQTTSGAEISFRPVCQIRQTRSRPVEPLRQLYPSSPGFANYLMLKMGMISKIS